MKNIPKTLCLALALFHVGCQSEYNSEWADPVKKRQRIYSEKLPLNQPYPQLLAREDAHKVSVWLYKAPPSCLGRTDIKEICEIVGRIPGLLDYKIDMIMKSTMFPGCIDVYVSHKKVIIKNENGWKAYLVKGVYANDPQNVNDPNDWEMLKRWKLGNVELLPLEKEYPDLLPPEKTRDVKRLKNPPTELTSEDLNEIYKLVGRVPGIREYKVWMMFNSENIKGRIEVFVGNLVVISMRKENCWRVYRVATGSP